MYKKKRYLLSCFTAIATIIISISLCALFFSFIYLNKEGPLLNDQVVIIEKGFSTKKIVKVLEANSIIDSPIIFWAITKILNNKLQAGEYYFEKNITPQNVLEKITNGLVIVHKLTIPEGATNHEIITRINEIDILSGNINIDYKEGYLMPETYHYVYGDNKQELVERMHNKAVEVHKELWTTRSPDLPYKTMEEALTMASIIEKETGKIDERKRVAAVFINRLNKNMKLQADPTVVYAITNGKYLLERKLTKDDLMINSPFNTYVNFGLPPTPIANPGLLSIEAALNPISSDELYFVVNGNGGHNFAPTLEKHNNNVKHYRHMQKLNKEN